MYVAGLPCGYFGLGVDLVGPAEHLSYQSNQASETSENHQQHAGNE